VEKWKQALLIFGPTNGLIYNEVSGEVKFREEIVEAICELVPPETRWDDSHVQGRSRLCEVIREKVKRTQVSTGFNVRVIGLYGVGGLGKSTICKTLCNDYIKEFQGKVAHVEFERDGEVELMRGVLRKLTDTQLEVLAEFDKGKCTMHLKKKMHQHNVFLAIDNVSDTEEAIEQSRVYLTAGFTKGSVVVVTSHSMEVLKGVGVAVEDCMKMPKLDAREARSLFLHQVLGVPDEISTKDETHIMRCVKLCRFQEGDKSGYRYLPLPLKLLGIQSSTLGYDPRGWVEDMDDSSNKVMGSVFDILRRSFDALREDEKHLFMDAILYYPGFRMCLRFQITKFLSIFEWLSMVH
jgi:acylphosphatase